MATRSTIKLDQIRKELACAICHGCLQTPTLLSCNHSYCRQCLVKLHNSSANKLQLECPICRQTTALPEGKVEALKTNFQLQSLIDIAAEKTSRSAISLDAHAMQPPQKEPLCEKHGKPLEHFCTDCYELLCSKCITAHREHRWNQIDEPDVQAMVEDLCAEAQEIAAQAENMEKQLHINRNGVLSNGDQTREAIQAYFRKAQETLQDREMDLLSAVQQYTDASLAALTKHSRQFKKDKSILQSFEERRHDIGLLADWKGVKNQLEACKKSVSANTANVASGTPILCFREDSSILQTHSTLGALNERWREQAIYGAVRVPQASPPVCVEGGIYMNEERTSPARLYSDRCDRSPSPHPIKQLDQPMSSPSSQQPPQPSAEPLYDDIQTKTTHRPRQAHRYLNVERIYEPLPAAENPQFPPKQHVPAPPPLPPRDQDEMHGVKLISVIGNDQLRSSIMDEKVSPNGVCCDPVHDTVIITDVNNHCVRLLDGKGNFLERIGKEGKGKGEFNVPVAVAVTSDSVYIADKGNSRIQKFTHAGQFCTMFGRHRVKAPAGLAVDHSGNLYVSDSEKSQILIYQKDKYLRSIGSTSKDGFVRFKTPAGIAIDKQGRLFVADQGIHCVWKMTMEGKVLQKIGIGHLRSPYGVAVAHDDSLVVSENTESRISIFSLDGELIRRFGGIGSEPGMFHEPRHVCVNSKGQIIVTDDGRLQFFDIPHK